MTTKARIVPPLPRTERGAVTKVSFDAPGERVLYTNGNNVMWRSLAPLLEDKGGEKPEDIFVYKTHAKKTTCVVMSPNSQWVVSGDETGAIKVWGAKGDNVLKNEYRLWNGPIRDISWSSDSTRIFACGDGAEKRAAAIIWDTGSNTGVVEGHTKCINSISFRSQRPFRVMTGSEDMSVIFHQGPPFKFLKSDTSHSNFVNWVGFSPDGEWAASAGSDSKLVLFNGKEGDKIKEFEKPAGMTGTIWAAAWSPDSNKIVTAGGDKKIRIWDREAGKQVGEAQVGAAALEDMQVGVSWAKESTVVSVALDGRMLCWEVAADGSVTLKTSIDGTQGGLTAVACDGKTGTLLAGSNDGTFAIYAEGKPCKKVKVGKTVQHIMCHSSKDIGPGEAWVIALDNKVRRVTMNGDVLGEPVDVKEFATGVGWLDELETKLLVGSSKGTFHCIGDKSIEWSKPGMAVRSPTAFATHPGDRAAMAVDKPDGLVNGIASQQYDIHLFGIAGATSADGIVELAVLQGHKAEVTSLRFSPTGEFLASCDADKTIKIWCLGAPKGGAKGGGYSAGDVPVAPAQMAFEFNGHDARVTSIAWMPDGNTLVSGGLDQNIKVWDVNAADSKVTMKAAFKKDFKSTSGSMAHRGGVTALAACGDAQFASVGNDGFLIVHSIS